MTIYYIDPSAEFNGNGLAPTPAASAGASGAFNTSPTLTVSNTYRIKRGTTYVVPSPSTTSGLRMLTLVGTPAAPTVIEAYYNSDGSDDTTQPRPIIDHNGGGNAQACVLVNGCQYVIVRNIMGINSMQPGGSAVRVRNSSDVLVTGCEGTANLNGVTVTQDTAAATMARITIDSGFYYGNACGILYTWLDAANSIIDSLTISNNKVYNNNVASVQRVGGIQHGASASSATVVNSDRGVRGIWIIGNECYGNQSYALTTYGARNGTRSSWIANNHVHHNNPLGLVDAHCIWVGASFDVLVEDNEVHDNTGFIGGNNGSCVGIFLDYQLNDTAIVGSRNIVRRNRIYNGWMGNTAVTKGQGAGVYLLNNQNCVIEDNLIYNGRCGIVIARDTVAAPAHTILNNTIVGMIDNDGYSGVGIMVDVGNNHIVKNNVIKGCGKEGIFINSSLTGVVETNNAIYDANVAKVVSAAFTTLTPGTPDATDVLIDPMLSNGYRPLSTSTLIGAGAHTTYKCDAAGVQFWNPPSIGAYEYVRPRVER